MIKAFEFEDDGRTYTCTVEKRTPSSTEIWWWFAVSGDGQRYAPFHADAGDTRDSVRQRIVAFYGERLARRAMPAATRGPWSRREKPAAPATPASTPAIAPADAS